MELAVTVEDLSCIARQCETQHRIAAMMLFPNNRDDQALWCEFRRRAQTASFTAAPDAEGSIYEALKSHFLPVATRAYEHGLQSGQIIASVAVSTNKFRFGVPSTKFVMQENLSTLGSSRAAWARRKTKNKLAYPQQEKESNIIKRCAPFNMVAAMWAVRAASLYWQFEFPKEIEFFPVRPVDLLGFLRQMEIVRRAALLKRVPFADSMLTLSRPVLDCMRLTHEFDPVIRAPVATY